jgi:hypothetical protein
MNRAQLRSRVRALTNIYSTGILSDDDINAALDDVHFEVCGGFEWPFLQSSTMVFVTSETPVYELPSSVRKVLLVTSVGPHRTLTAASQFDMDRLAPTEGTGLPTHYTLNGSLMRLYPRPDQSEGLRVLFTTTAASLSNDSHTPPFLEEFHPLYAYGAAVRLLTERSGNQNKVAALGQTAAVYLDRMRRHYLTTRDHAPVSLGRGRWR